MNTIFDFIGLYWPQLVTILTGLGAVVPSTMALIKNFKLDNKLRLVEEAFENLYEKREDLQSEIDVVLKSLNTIKTESIASIRRQLFELNESVTDDVENTLKHFNNIKNQIADLVEEARYAYTPRNEEDE